jgi:hypothetical protein
MTPAQVRAMARDVRKVAGGETVTVENVRTDVVTFRGDRTRRYFHAWLTGAIDISRPWKVPNRDTEKAKQRREGERARDERAGVGKYRRRLPQG